MAVYPLEFAQAVRASARGHLSDLRALLALSMLMAEAADEDDILELAVDAVSTLPAAVSKESISATAIGGGR